MFTWMSWTLPVAIFFASIAVILAGMTTWNVISPSIERKGFLPMSTTRGDRLFIGLLSSGFFHLAWVGISDAHVGIATVICAFWMVFLMAKG